ncbi:MAG: Gfo/Idh/MocA family oxidoreductase, partial [Lentisphaerae bacterium]|nr:Gfo/Idh/MocA family oxidoreductase [Lentisphaerota bacterium]
ATGLKAVDGVKITALCDIVAEARAVVRDAHAPDAAEFADYMDLIQSGLIDAVTVATPVYLHCPMTLAALDAGHHVLCEKPMGMSQIETAEMVAASRAVDKVLQINLSRRYNPFFQGMAKLVHSGRLGEPHHIRAVRVHTTAPDRGWSPGADWFVTKSKGGGIVGDIGVHVGDMMRWFFGDVESVRALTDTRRPDIDVVDNVAVLFRFRNGATGVLELSWTRPVGHMCVEIHGSDGILLAGANAKDGIKILGRDNEVERLSESDLTQPSPNSFQCFADAIRGVAPTPVPGELGHAMQRVIDAIHESGENGGTPVVL